MNASCVLHVDGLTFFNRMILKSLIICGVIS